MSSESITDKRGKLSPKWQRRFQVYDEIGEWNHLSRSKIYQNMSFFEKTFVAFNIWAFVFGILYYIYLGIAKRGMGIFLVFMILWLLLYHNDASPTLFKLLTMANSACFAGLANYYYYLKVTKGIDTFDPLKGLRAED